MDRTDREALAETLAMLALSVHRTASALLQAGFDDGGRTTQLLSAAGSCLVLLGEAKTGEDLGPVLERLKQRAQNKARVLARGVCSSLSKSKT